MTTKTDKQKPKPTTPQIAAVLSGAKRTHCLYCGEQGHEMVCDACDEKNMAANETLRIRAISEREGERLGHFSKKIPEEYRMTDEILRPEWSREVVNRWDESGRHGITFIGDSGSFKTRTAVKILEKAFTAGQVIEYHQAGDLRRKINALAREGKDSELLEDLGSVPILAIDDLGNQAWTDASEEFFLALMELRQGHRLKTIVTTQYPGKEFVLKLNSKRIATAIGRRIGLEFNWIVRTNRDPLKVIIEQPNNPHPIQTKP